MKNKARHRSTAAMPCFQPLKPPIMFANIPMQIPINNEDMPFLILCSGNENNKTNQFKN